MKKIHHRLLTIAIMSLVVSCQSHPRAEADKPVLTVTIEPLRYFTEAIAGDRFTVVSMVPRGAGPETYDPTPAQLMELARSRAYLRIGHIGFEQTWVERLKENAPGLPFYDLSQGVELIEGEEPHIWNSTANARIIARNILHTLCLLDSANAPVYTARYDTLQQRIARTDSLIRRTLSAPQADRAFLIYHPALTYFARDYGLRQIAIENEGKEPSPARLKELMDDCRADSIHVIFVQPEFDRRNAELIARQTGTRIADINPLSYDWEAEMLNVATQLTNPVNPR